LAKPISIQELARHSITTGTVLDEDYMMLALTNDARTKRDAEDRHAVLALRRDGVWKAVPLPYAVRSQAVINTPQRCILSVSDVGIVRRSAPQGGDEEANVGVASGLRVIDRTILNEVRSIEGVAYVAGARRSAYRRDAPGTWACIDQQIHTEEPILSFQSIHGFSASEIYAVGASGELWQYDGRHWERHDSGTNAKLNKVLCAPDGMVYAAGMGGTLLRGRNAQWEVMEDISRNYNFWSLEYFAGRLFLTANTLLVLELVDDRVRPVAFDECPIPGTAYHLSVSGGSLHSFGAKDIRRFDGTQWHNELTL
jgi:hypothetical protein